MMGAAIATIAAYTTMFVGHGVVVAAHLPRRVPVASRRDRGRRGSRAGRRSASSPGGGLPVAVVLALAYPLALLPLGFYLPSERRAIGARLRLAR